MAQPRPPNVSNPRHADWSPYNGSKLAATARNSMLFDNAPHPLLEESHTLHTWTSMLIAPLSSQLCRTGCHGASFPVQAVVRAWQTAGLRGSLDPFLQGGLFGGVSKLSRPVTYL
jgi:hypothetical protein